MARRRTTVELDEQLLDAADAEAERTGRSEDDVIEDALRRHFDGRRASVVDEVWARNAGDALSEDEALTLARSELRAMRQERGVDDKAAS
ncbi:MAG TPA: ribbon-helix-helix protein, CopG family [Acidimicrobiales bacterium]|nr:ribbon-helix-helix protein, CopG family [Acidimicrobiales bacterium]